MNVKKNINIKKIKTKSNTVSKFNNKNFSNKSKIQKRISESKKSLAQKFAPNNKTTSIKKTGGCNCHKSSSR